ncbi:MAG: GGDEF domain-containing protein [Planctomycetes bacterium]|nr:GGDEF domain-containing protein [Planctomycetota bacterium]
MSTTNTDKASGLIEGNLPVSLSPAFTGDELALIVGTCLEDAVAAFDAASGCLVGYNLRLLALLERRPEDLERSPLSLESFVVREDHPALQSGKLAAMRGSPIRLEVRIDLGAGRSGPVHISMSRFRWRRRDHLLVFLRPSPPAEEIPRYLQQVAEQKARVREAIQSSLRLYQLNEKIRKTPSFTQKLLHAESEEDLLAEAARLLTEESGLGYRDVTFLFLERGVLRVAYSTTEPVGKECGRPEESRFAPYLRGGVAAPQPSGAELVVALESRGQILGLCEVTMHAREEALFHRAGLLSDWQRQVLQDIGGIIGLMADNLRLNREIRRQSRMDTLTEAYNRHHFVERLSTEVQRASRYSRPVSVLFLDLDDFKRINDLFGHLQGDEVLRRVGRLLIEKLRDVDVVCRYGGDEFVVLLPETGLDMACRTAEKLLTHIRAMVFTGPGLPPEGLRITASMGVSVLSPGQGEVDLLQAADAAVYRAKRLGRDRVESAPTATPQDRSCLEGSDPP